ncbi:MAG: hypothetical protein MR357_05740 [Anaeroplasma sp.]|nr:hypothetical protein [Anaeroplasma sp.]
MDLKIVNQILDSYLKEKNLVLDNVELVKESGYLILRVSIDKENGIDIDELAAVNEYLSERIDKYDSDMPEYMLEVCSPGAEKLLKSISEVKANVGKYVHVEIINMIYEGVLESVNENKITLKINAKGRFKKVVLDYEDIKIIRLAVKI